MGTPNFGNFPHVCQPLIEARIQHQRKQKFGLPAPTVRRQALLQDVSYSLNSLKGVI